MLYYHNTDATEKQGKNEERLEREIKTRWQPLKIKNLRLADAYGRIGLDGRAERVADCGTFLQFRMEQNGAKLVRANFCRDRLCPKCQWRRSLKIFGQAAQMMDWIEKQGKYRFAFLTLTVRNCADEELPDTLDGLFNGWKKLTDKRSKAWQRVVLGSKRNIEITRNLIEGTWHPHIHTILAVPPAYFDRMSKYYLTQRDWTSLWQKAAGLQYTPIVHIEAVRPDRGGDRRILNELSGSPEKLSRIDQRKLLGSVTEDNGLGVSYRQAVAKASQYMSKDGSDSWLGAVPVTDEAGQLLNPHLVLSNDEIDSNVRTLLESVSGRRLTGETGIFRQARKALNLDDGEDGDLVHIDNESIREDMEAVMINYRWRCGVYVKE